MTKEQAISQDVRDFIYRELVRGTPPNTVIEQLVSVGYERQVAERAVCDERQVAENSIRHRGAIARPKRISRSNSKDFELAATFALIDLVSEYTYDELDPVQQVAHLVFYYEAEVNNGGHLQYFHNRGSDEAALTIKALQLIGASEAAEILTEAIGRHNAIGRDRAGSLEEYHENEIKHEFLDLDNRFPGVSGPLEEYRRQNEQHFIEWLP
jgi:hypothetical protein